MGGPRGGGQRREAGQPSSLAFFEYSLFDLIFIPADQIYSAKCKHVLLRAIHASFAHIDRLNTSRLFYRLMPFACLSTEYTGR